MAGPAALGLVDRALHDPRGVTAHAPREGISAAAMNLRQLTMRVARDGSFETSGRAESRARRIL